MLVSWFPGDGSAEIIFQPPTYTAAQPDLLGKIPVDHVTVVSPDQDGETLLSSNLTVREDHTLSYIVNAATASELATAIRTLSKAFSPKAGAGTLKVVADDGETLYIDCSVRSGYPEYSINQADRSSTAAGLASYWQRVNIALIAHKPWWYTDLTPETFNPWVGMEFPIEFDPTTGMDFGSYADTKTLVNGGDLATPATIQIDGPMVNPVLTNTTTGEYISLTKTLTAGQRLYISTEFGDITCEIRNATTNALIEDAFQYASVDSIWFWLVSGENDILFESDDANDGSSMIISWRDRYSTM